ncbi:MAG: hypothetical protein R6V20_05005 [Desulfobia sp.]
MDRFVIILTITYLKVRSICGTAERIQSGDFSALSTVTVNGYDKEAGSWTIIEVVGQEKHFSYEPAWLDQAGQPQRTMKIRSFGMANTVSSSIFG